MIPGRRLPRAGYANRGFDLPVKLCSPEPGEAGHAVAVSLPVKTGGAA